MSSRARIPGTYGPWPLFGPLSRATVRQVGRGRPQGQPPPRRPDTRRVEHAARIAALRRPRTSTELPAKRSFVDRLFRRRSAR